MNHQLNPISRDPKNALLNESHFKAHALLWICIFIVAASLFWSCVTELDEITRSDKATVVPSGQTKVIQSLEGGIIKKILVMEGQAVHKGQVLAEIDDIHAQSQLEKNTIHIHALTLRCERLIAELKQCSFVITGEFKERYPAQVRSEQLLYDSRQRDYLIKMQLIDDDRMQLEQQILEQRSELMQTEKSYELKKTEYNMMVNLKDTGAVSPQELLQIQRSLNEFEGHIEQTQHRIQKSIEQQRSFMNRKEEVRSIFQKEASSEYNRAKVELNQLIEEQTLLSDREKRTQLRAPVNGVVNKVYFHTEGGVLRSGDTLFDVVPVDDKLVIEAKIYPKDIGFIHQGMSANVKVTAFDFCLYGGLKGIVEHISPDILTDRESSYYLVRIVTNKSYLERFEQEYPIIPGMSASVDILTGKRTVMDYMLKPILKARQRAMTER
jgi:adhesin transport system membrane fusion protein